MELWTTDFTYYFFITVLTIVSLSIVSGIFIFLLVTIQITKFYHFWKLEGEIRRRNNEKNNYRRNKVHIPGRWNNTQKGKEGVLQGTYKEKGLQTTKK